MTDRPDPLCPRSGHEASFDHGIAWCDVCEGFVEIKEWRLVDHPRATPEPERKP